MIKIKVTTNDMTKELLQDLKQKQMSFVMQGGEVIRTEMVVRAPVDKGNLRNSVQSMSFVEDGKATSETGPTAEYAPYVEYGTGVYAADGNGRKTPWVYKDDEGKVHFTHGMKAQPFAEPGFQAAKPTLDNLSLKVMKE